MGICRQPRYNLLHERATRHDPPGARFPAGAVSVGLAGGGGRLDRRPLGTGSSRSCCSVPWLADRRVRRPISTSFRSRKGSRARWPIVGARSSSPGSAHARLGRSRLSSGTWSPSRPRRPEPAAPSISTSSRMEFSFSIAAASSRTCSRGCERACTSLVAVASSSKTARGTGISSRTFGLARSSRYDERAHGGRLFDEADARQAVEKLEVVAQLCERLLAESN